MEEGVRAAGGRSGVRGHHPHRSSERVSGVHQVSRALLVRPVSCSIEPVPGQTASVAYQCVPNVSLPLLKSPGDLNGHHWLVQFVQTLNKLTANEALASRSKLPITY
jgi:hypothetical protein